jgi:hypothetical protein
VLHFANALPNLTLAQQLNRKVEAQLKESLTHLFEISEDFIDEPLRAFKNKIKDLTVNPLYYALNFEWLTALEQDNIGSLRQCVNLLTQPGLATPLEPYLTFESQQIPHFFEELFQQQTQLYVPIGLDYKKPSPQAFRSSIQIIEQAKAVLKETVPEILDEHQTFVKSILIIDRVNYGSGTSFTFFGLISTHSFPETASLLKAIEMLVHETAHLYIFGLSSFDALTLNPPTQLFKAPFREDPRPMMGIYHATFVLGRLLYVFDKLEKSLKDLSFKAEIISKVKDYENRFDSSWVLVKENAQMTELGERLMLSTEKMVRECRSQRCFAAAEKGVA